MKINSTAKVLCLIAFSALIMIALAFIFCQPASANQNWPKNTDEPRQPETSGDVAGDPMAPEFSTYYDMGGEWVIEGGDDITYEGVTIVMNHSIVIQDGGALTLNSTTLKFNDTNGDYGIVLEGSGEIIYEVMWTEEHVIYYDNDLIVDSATTYTKKGNLTTIKLDGDLTVTNNAVLTLDEVVLETDSTYDIRTITIEAGSSLVAEDAQINNLDPRISGDVIVKTLVASGTLDVSDTSISNHGILIETGDSSIEDSILTTNSEAPSTAIDIIGNGISPTIQGCSISSDHDEGIGIHVGGGATPTIQGNSFNAISTGAFENGFPILVDGMSDPEISGNTFGDDSAKIENSCIKAVGSKPMGSGGKSLDDDNTFDFDNAARHVEIYWYITVEVTNSNNGEGIKDATVEYEDVDGLSPKVTKTTDESGIVVLELLDYLTTRKAGGGYATGEYGSYFVNVSAEDETAEETSTATDNEDIPVSLNVITYDFEPQLKSDLVANPMTIGNPYTIEYLVINHGSAIDEEVSVEITIGDTLVSTETVVMDQEQKVVQTAIDVPTDAARTTDISINVVFVGDQNDADNEQITPGVGLNSPPVATLDTPAKDDGIIPLSGTYVDADGADNISAVEIRFDGGDWIDTTWTVDDPAWTYDWDTTGVVNGDHTIEVAARDKLAIDSEIVQVIVNVKNLPGITITALEGFFNDETVPDLINGESGDSVDLTGTTTKNAYSDNDVSMVKITIMMGETVIKDGVNAQAVDSWENWNWEWTGINILADGDYDITVTVFDDQAYNRSETYSVKIWADNVASDPTVAIATEDPLYLNDSSNTIDGTAGDDLEVTLVQYKIGNAVEWTDITDEGDWTEWSFDVLNNIIQPGAGETIYVRSYDGQAYSTEISITVTRPNPSYDLGVGVITLAASGLKEGVENTISIPITKTPTTGNIPAVDVAVYIGTGEDEMKIAQQTQYNLTIGKTISITFTPSVAHVGLKDIRVVIDPAELINDSERGNNEATKSTGTVGKATPTGDDDDDDDDSPVPAFALTVVAVVVVSGLIALRRRR